MASKAAITRQKKATSVAKVGETQGPIVASGLADVLKPSTPPDEQVPDFAPMIRALSRLLIARNADMVRADETHERELGDDATPRDNREAQAAELGSTLVDLREMAIGMFGSGKLSALGFKGTAPRDPVALERYAGEIASSLRTANPGTSRIPGAHWDGEEIADDLDAKRAALRSCINKVVAESREAQVTLEAKNRAFAAHDNAYTGVAQIFSGLLRLAGSLELAEKVWPTTRRPSAADEEDEEPGPISL